MYIIKDFADCCRKLPLRLLRVLSYGILNESLILARKFKFFYLGLQLSILFKLTVQINCKCYIFTAVIFLLYLVGVKSW